MAPLTKDSVDVTVSASEVASRPAAPAPKPSTPAAGQLRADARSVEIPVKVHGSKVSAAPAGAAPRTEPFEEQTSTMIVFPQGGVIRMSTAVAIGQMLVVTNQKTRQDAICRVIKVRTFTNMQGYVEVEFTHKQDGYWGVQFGANPPAAPSSSPTATPAPVVQVAPPAPQVSAPQPVAAAPVKPVQEIPVAPAVAPQVSLPPVATTIPAPPVAPKPEAAAPPQPAAPQAVTPIQSAQVTPLPPPTFVPPPPPAPPVIVAVAPPPAPVKSSVTPPPAAPPKQESPFVWIGTQEEVQPAASATETIKPGLDLSSMLSTPTRAAAPVELKLHELPKIELPTIESLTAPAEYTYWSAYDPNGNGTTASVRVSFGPRYGFAQTSLSLTDGSGYHDVGISHYETQPNPGGANVPVDISEDYGFGGYPPAIDADQLTEVTADLGTGNGDDVFAIALLTVFLWD